MRANMRIAELGKGEARRCFAVHSFQEIGERTGVDSMSQKRGDSWTTPIPSHIAAILKKDRRSMLSLNQHTVKP
jgi:hypothetical protein